MRNPKKSADKYASGVSTMMGQAKEGVEAFLNAAAADYAAARTAAKREKASGTDSATRMLNNMRRMQEMAGKYGGSRG